MLHEPFITVLISGAIIASIPLMLAALGEMLSEQSGVLNISLEGMMLAGAYCGFWVTYYTDSFWLGFLAGAAGGLFIAGIMAILCVYLYMNQVIIGIALTLGVQGITALLHHFTFANSYPRLSAAPVVSIPFLVDIPYIGEAFFKQHSLVFISIGLIFITSILYKKSVLRLQLIAAGSNPAALDSFGISVIKTRFIMVLITGFLAGLGGAYMATIATGIFVPMMTNGAGFIAIVLAMLARGNMLWIILSAFIFGCSLSIATALQLTASNIPSDLIHMLPFIIIMLMLIIFAKHSYLPPSLGIPYFRGKQ